MPTPSTEIVRLLACFACAMSAPSFSNALVLLYGAILAPGRRTVAAALRVRGKAPPPFPLVGRGWRCVGGSPPPPPGSPPPVEPPASSMRRERSQKASQAENPRRGRDNRL